MLREAKQFVSLVGIYLALGRKGAIPVGIALLGSWIIVFWYVLIIEFVQIPLFYFLLGPVAHRLPLVQRLKNKFAPQKSKIESSLFFRRAQKFGAWGIFLVVAMPAGTGGVLGGILLARILRIEAGKSLTAVISGIITCNLVLVIATQGFRQLFLFLGRS
jgi:uncharacterized membrane protein